MNDFAPPWKPAPEQQVRRSAPPHTPKGVVVAQISRSIVAPLAPPCSTSWWRSGANPELIANIGITIWKTK
jgi:hypothetical protein